MSARGDVLIAGDYRTGSSWQDGRSRDLGPFDPVAVSADGRVVVGISSEAPSGGFVVADGRVTALGERYPTDVSADGSTIAGYFPDAFYVNNIAFRSVDGVVTTLGSFRPDTYMQANAISADGSTVVGWGQYPPEPEAGVIDEAFRWRDGVLTGLGGTESGYSVAVDVSADGAVVVGTVSRGFDGFRAVAWRDGGMIDLGVLPGNFHSEAAAVSGSGSLVFGHSFLCADECRWTAFVWDAAHGMRPLVDVLTAAGVDVGDAALENVIAVSLDGLTIAVRGRDAAGTERDWVARLPGS